MRCNESQQRSGTVLVCVLACSLIAITLGASAMHLMLKSNRQSQDMLAVRQTQWLLTVGVQRARVKLRRGELEPDQWRVPDTVLPAGHGIVQTRVEETANSNINVTVTAEYQTGEFSSLAYRKSYSFSYMLSETTQVTEPSNPQSEQP